MKAGLGVLSLLIVLGLLLVLALGLVRALVPKGLDAPARARLPSAPTDALAAASGAARPPATQLETRVRDELARAADAAEARRAQAEKP